MYSKITDPGSGKLLSLQSPAGKKVLKTYLRTSLVGGGVDSSLACFSKYKNPNCCNYDMQCKWVQGSNTGACVSKSMGNIGQSYNMQTECGPNFKELLQRLEQRLDYHRQKLDRLKTQRRRLRELFRQELNEGENILHDDVNPETLALQRKGLVTVQRLRNLHKPAGHSVQKNQRTTYYNSPMGRSNLMYNSGYHPDYNGQSRPSSYADRFSKSNTPNNYPSFQNKYI